MINIIICEGKKSERVILNDYINTFFYNYNFEYNIKEFENGGDLLKKYPNIKACEINGEEHYLWI